MRLRARTRGPWTRARSVAGFAAGLAAAWLWLAPALAQDQEHLPLPRFASLDSNEVNLRAEQGWQFMAITSELKMMLSGAAAEVKKLTSGAAPRQEMAKY